MSKSLDIVSKILLLSLGSPSFKPLTNDIHRNNKAYFGSLSKLNLIQKSDANTMSVTIDGQPLINASFYVPKQLSTLLVNGKKSNFDLDNEYLSFKLDNRVKE